MLNNLPAKPAQTGSMAYSVLIILVVAFHNLPSHQTACAQSSTNEINAVEGQTFKLPPPTRRIRLNPQTGNVESTAIATGGNQNAVTVYQNDPTTTYPGVFFAPGENRAIADDLLTISTEGCALSSYDIIVGRLPKRCSLTQQACETDDDCQDFMEQTCQPWDDDGFTVDVQLFDDCPDFGNPIAGTQATLTVDENAAYVLTVDLGDNPVVIPPRLWVEAEFDKPGAGWSVGTQAQIGFTANHYHFPIPQFACGARLGGILHAGFGTTLYCDGNTDIALQHLAYYNDAPEQPPIPHPAGDANRRLADDLTLVDSDCKLSAYSLGVQATSPYTAQIELWRDCDPDTVINGTQFTFNGTGDGFPEYAYYTLPVPVELDSARFYVAVQGSTPSFGPLNAFEAELGTTDATFGIFDWPGQGDGCGWMFSGQHVGFHATVFCEGPPPRGACCDSSDILNPDFQACRETSRSDCFGSQRRFLLGGKCPQTCSMTGETCETDDDCPNVCEQSGTPCSHTSECNDTEVCAAQHCVELGESFDPPCGTAACCLPTDDGSDSLCENLLPAECKNITDKHGNPGIPNTNFCDVQAEFCLPWACNYATQHCHIGQPGTGCRTPACCRTVCDFDNWCCDIEWDRLCSAWAGDICTQEPDFHDCESAAPLETNSTVSVNLGNASSQQDVASSCCLTTPEGFRRDGWFTFVATHESADIDTCGTMAEHLSDTVLTVYEPTDDQSPDAACNSLVPLACSAESSTCSNPLNAGLCVDGLEPGQTYYVNLAHSFEGLDDFELSITSPCVSDATEACPAADIAWTDRPDNWIDAGRWVPAARFDTVFLDATIGTASRCCWDACADEDSPPISVTEIDRTETGTLALGFDRPSQPGAVCITYAAGETNETQLGYIIHPGNVNADDVADGQDIRTLIEFINDPQLPAYVGQWDIDRNGLRQPEDLLRLIDVLNGGSGTSPAFGTEKPACNTDCP